MKRSLFLLASVFLLAGLAGADTVYQVNAQGKQTVVQRHAIVVKDDSSSLVFKHFELKEHRVVKVTLNKGSLPYVIQPGSPAERRQIVETWKRFGFSVTLTDLTGKESRLSDVFLDFYPPGGRGSLFESFPPRTSFLILIDGGGAEEKDFSEIDRVEFQGEHLKITLRNGQVLNGRFLLPTDKPVEARLLGISDRYDPSSEDVFDVSIPLLGVKELRFEPLDQ